MTTALSRYLSLYAESHANPANKLLHLVCVPPILYTIVALVASIPVPQSLQTHPLLNWGTLFSVLALGFYLRHSLKFFLWMTCALGLSLWLWWVMAQAFPTAHIFINLTIFVVAWIGQFIGHKIEGKRPSFFHDLLFLLIGPLWVIKWFEARFFGRQQALKA